MLMPTDLDGVPADLARAVISYAVTVAPCLDSLPDPAHATDSEKEYRSRALAILARIAKAAKKRGDAMVKSQRIGPAAVDYGDVGTYFSSMDEAALRGICAALNGRGRPADIPVGSFPKHGIVSDVWPERGNRDGV